MSKSVYFHKEIIFDHFSTMFQFLLLSAVILYGIWSNFGNLEQCFEISWNTTQMTERAFFHDKNYS